MRKTLLVLCLAMCASSIAFAQDNPLLFGAPFSDNGRSHVYDAPYIFGGTNVPVVKWKMDLSVGAYQTRRNAWHNFTFDEQGGGYFRGGGNVELGIYKFDTATGAKVWFNPAVADTGFSTGSAIIGQEAVYAARYDAANPTVYALDQNTGATIWESAPLPMQVGLNMALHDGVIYGSTQRDAAGNNYAFAIDASTGAVLHATPYQTSGDTAYGNMTFVANAFGQGEHGMYWYHNDNGDLGEAIYGVSISNAGAAKAWTYTPARTYPSNILYNPDMNALYAVHWADYGSAIECLDPATGALRWNAQPPNITGGLNGGFYMSHTLKPDGTGLIFGGFGHDVLSITDPGDLSGASITDANVDWLYDGLDVLGEAQTNAVTIVDPSTGQAIYISGTTANEAGSEARRLFAVDVATGTELWEWFNPGDVSPYTTGFNFRGLSVGPDGTLYYFDAEEGANGTLYAIGSAPIPEPGTMLMMGSGLVGLLALLRRKK